MLMMARSAGPLAGSVIDKAGSLTAIFLFTGNIFIFMLPPGVIVIKSINLSGAYLPRQENPTQTRGRQRPLVVCPRLPKLSAVVLKPSALTFMSHSVCGRLVLQFSTNNQ
jgi:hypothetical protein